MSARGVTCRVEGEAEAKGEEQQQEEGDGAANEGADGDVDKVAIPEDVQDDLEVAWENLEAARVAFSKAPPEPANRKKLAEIHLRLGDLQKLNGNFQVAIDDYSKSLDIYSQVLPPVDRTIADLYYSLATSFIFASANDEAQERQLKEKGLEHYIRCADIMEKLLAKAENDAASTEGTVQEKAKADVEDFKGILQELQETIEATKVELNDAKPASSAMPVTTIGFGAPSSAAGASAAAAAQGSNAVPMLTVKKKPKPAQPTEAAAAALATAAATVDEGSKKRAAPDGADAPEPKDARVE